MRAPVSFFISCPLILESRVTWLGNANCLRLLSSISMHAASFFGYRDDINWEQTTMMASHLMDLDNRGNVTALVMGHVKHCVSSDP